MVRSAQENYDIVYVILELIINDALPEPTKRRLTDKIAEALRPEHKTVEHDPK